VNVIHRPVADVTSVKQAGLLEVRNKEHKYNLTPGPLEKSKSAQHAYEEGQKMCWKEAKVLQIEPNTIYRK
jgi:hypothetical protein